MPFTNEAENRIVEAVKQVEGSRGDNFMQPIISTIDDAYAEITVDSGSGVYEAKEKVFDGTAFIDLVNGRLWDGAPIPKIFESGLVTGIAVGTIVKLTLIGSNTGVATWIFTSAGSSFPDFVTVVYDEDDEEFTVSWSIPVYELKSELIHGNLLGARLDRATSNSGQGFGSPVFVFDKPASNESIRMYFDTVDRLYDNDNMVKWRDEGAGNITSPEADTTSRQITSTYLGLSTIVTDIDLNSDGTFSINLAGQQSTPKYPYLIERDLGFDQHYGFNRNTQKLAVIINSFPTGVISFETALIPVSTSSTVFIEWSTGGVATLVQTLSGSELTSRVLCAITIGADKQVTNFTVSAAMTTVFPNTGDNSITVNDGDTLRCVGGIIIDKV